MARTRDTDEERSDAAARVALEGDRSLDVPDDADAAEAAAIAAAVGAHLRDCEVAAASDPDEAPRTVDEWKLAGRLRALGRRRWPSDVREGEEWKAAARSFY